VTHPCTWCGHCNSRELRWDVESNTFECWQHEKCEERRVERGEELETLGNQGATA
jgi:hypothetical protein